MEKLSKVKMEASNLLGQQIRDVTKGLWCGPLHELLVSDDVEGLKTLLQPDARNQLYQALQSPERFLKLNPKAPDVVPDICILFEELEKRGRLINLQEWFDVFKSRSQPTDGAGPMDSLPEATTLQLQYRFVRTVSELEMLGYLKKSTRRRGHVQAVVHA